MGKWRILFTTLHGRRPRLAVAILLVVMFALVAAQPFVPNILWAWLPIGVLLAFVFERAGWLVRDPDRPKSFGPWQR
jgi:hypothetical protein